jgi:hypothetical protein
MAVITITPANAIKGTGAVTAIVTAGEALSAGFWVYKKASDSLYYKADADDAAKDDVAGMVLGDAAANQEVVLQSNGVVAVGAVLTVDEIYVLSGTLGKMFPLGDLSTGQYLTILGPALTTSTLDFHLKTTSIAAP